MNHLQYTHYLSIWKNLTLPELKKEHTKLIEKINLVPDSSKSTKVAMMEVLNMLETYLESREAPEIK